MLTEKVSADQEGWLEQASAVLRKAGLVAFPTDTVYGVAADPFQVGAVERLYEAKLRPREKAIPILIGSSEDLGRIAREVPESARLLMEAFWPGPLTLILKKSEEAPAIVSRTGTVGLRMPDHPVALRLLRACGPLAVTSANISGRSETREAAQVMNDLAGKIELVIDGGKTPGGQPSTVVDCTADPPTILRGGPVSMDELNGTLDQHGCLLIKS